MSAKEMQYMPWEVTDDGYGIYHRSPFIEAGEGDTYIARVDGRSVPADLLCTDEDMREHAILIATAPAMKQRLEFAKRLLLQGDADGALKEIELGLSGDYEE